MRKATIETAMLINIIQYIAKDAVERKVIETFRSLIDDLCEFNK